MAAGGIPSYTVSELVRQAQAVPSEFKIPKIAESLILPLTLSRKMPETSHEEDTLENLFEGITTNIPVDVSMDAPVFASVSTIPTLEKEKEKFYIDETNMIERRFLPQDTRTFESVRTVDLFASSCLCETAIDCLRNVAGVDALISVPMRQHFLRGGLAGMESSWFDVLWEHYIPLSQRREYTMAEWGYDRHDVEAVKRHIRVRSGSGGNEINGEMALLSLAIALGKAVVLEKMDHSVKTLGACPLGFDEEIYWIKQAPDGYLGVKITFNDAEKRFRETPDLFISTREPGRKDLSYFTMSSMKVPELKDHLKRLGGVPGKLKKAELVQAILLKSLWGMIVV